MLTTKFPLCAVFMELAAWVPKVSGGCRMCLHWVPRLQNCEAGELSNEVFASFDPATRVKLVMEEIEWIILREII